MPSRISGWSRPRARPCLRERSSGPRSCSGVLRLGSHYGDPACASNYGSRSFRKYPEMREHAVRRWARRSVKRVNAKAPPPANWVSAPSRCLRASPKPGVDAGSRPGHRRFQPGQVSSTVP